MATKPEKRLLYFVGFLLLVIYFLDMTYVLLKREVETICAYAEAKEWKIPACEEEKWCHSIKKHFLIATVVVAPTLAICVLNIYR